MGYDRRPLLLSFCTAVLLNLCACGGASSIGAGPTPPSQPVPAIHNEWTWVNGANVVNQPGTYGQQGTPAAASTPGAREGALTWTDASGNFWMFGGIAQPSASSDIGISRPLPTSTIRLVGHSLTSTVMLRRVLVSSKCKQRPPMTSTDQSWTLRPLAQLLQQGNLHINAKE